MWTSVSRRSSAKYKGDQLKLGCYKKRRHCEYAAQVCPSEYKDQKKTQTFYFPHFLIPTHPPPLLCSPPFQRFFPATPSMAPHSPKLETPSRRADDDVTKRK